jgi:polyisoprenoid-binding protein YceI
MKFLSIIFSVAVVMAAGAVQQSLQEKSSSTVSRNAVYQGTGKVSFYSVAPIENIDAHSNELKSLLNAETNEVAFTIPMRSFEFKNGKMQKDFNENYLESDKYPNATYKGKIIEKISWEKPGTYTATSKGTLTIHGVAKERTDTAIVTVTNGNINMKGEFSVRIADHGIKIPTLVIKKIAEVVSVKFEENYATQRNAERVSEK